MMEPPLESERYVPPSLRGAPTLLDDWHARCSVLQDQIARSGSHSPRDYAETEFRILRFLIKRYACTAEGFAPAQFPLKSGHFYFSRGYYIEQRIGELAGTVSLKKPKNEHEARVRVSGVLKRLSKQDAAPAPTMVEHQKADAPSLPPEAADQYSVAKSILEWKTLCLTELCDRMPQIRVSATYRLAHCGALDEIALLSDLLKVPAQSGEDPVERPMLLWAIKIIAIRNSGETYIPGVSDAATAPSSSNSS